MPQTCSRASLGLGPGWHGPRRIQGSPCSESTEDSPTHLQGNGCRHLTWFVRCCLHSNRSTAGLLLFVGRMRLRIRTNPALAYMCSVRLNCPSRCCLPNSTFVMHP